MRVQGGTATAACDKSFRAPAGTTGAFTLPVKGGRPLFLPLQVLASLPDGSVADGAGPVITEEFPDVFLVRGASANWVIIKDPDGTNFTLIDSGYPGDHQLLLESIESLGLKPADCVALLVTHGHVDHIGGAARLAADHGVPVWCHEAETANLEGPGREQVTFGQVLGKLVHRRVRHWLRMVLRLDALKPLSVTPARTFTDGDVLDVPGRPLVLHCPGHTSGSVAYLLDRPEGRVLISGDTLVSDHELLTGPVQAQLLPLFFSHDHDGLRRSFELLSSQNADVILPGHGPALRPATAG